LPPIEQKSIFLHFFLRKYNLLFIFLKIVSPRCYPELRNVPQIRSFQFIKFYMGIVSIASPLESPRNSWMKVLDMPDLLSQVVYQCRQQ